MVTMPEDWVERFHPWVRRTAVQYAKKYFGVVEQADIEQECWLWVLTHVGNVQGWDLEFVDDTKSVDRLVGKSLRNAAHDFCVKEKLRQIGAEPSDLFWYTPDMIKLLLPGAIAGDWKRVQDLSGNRGGGKDASEQGDWMAMAADIQSAYKRLSDEERRVVFQMYVIDGGAVAAHTDRPSLDATTMSANRVVKKMVKMLGGRKPFYDPPVVAVEEVEADE